ncbi:MAG: Crp/Fnr family transcriptional regulator [Williamsia sp.]|nr:Crp/Fnr family transcriptional regulator [Williamsia sp.]
MEKLALYFSAKGISEEEAVQITAAFTYKKIGKGDYFVEEGKVSKYLAFIDRGLFQYFYLKDGKEITTYITGDNSFLLSVISFYRQKPSKEWIRALADSELWMIHYKDLEKLKSTNEAFRTFYIGALENLAVGMDETRSNLITLSAEERYAVLMREEAVLLQKIPLQYLASILGITPRHLSRIRNNFR